MEIDHDETLDEFVQILGRIKDLLGEATIPDDEGINLVETIRRLRQSGNDEGADELAELFERAEKLKSQHLTKSPVPPNTKKVTVIKPLDGE